MRAKPGLSNDNQGQIGGPLQVEELQQPGVVILAAFLVVSVLLAEKGGSLLAAKPLCGARTACMWR